MSQTRTKLFLIVFACCAVSAATAEDWLRFRGPNGSGISDSSVPVEFGKETNIKWQIELPGRGVSSPIVVGDKILVTCYSGYGVDQSDPGELENLERHLVCIDRVSGSINWTATEPAAMPEDEYTGMGVPAHGYASHTPTSDGERVYAFYGKGGVFAYDMGGNRLWTKSVGTESGRMKWGSSSSPILHKDILIVLASDESEAMYGIDTKTGEERWKAEAGGFAGVWGTPALATGTKGVEVVVAVPEETWGLNAETGKVRWYAPGNGGGSHSIVIADGVAYSVGGSRGGSAGVAVKLGQSGEIEEVMWENNTSSRFATPLIYQGYVFTVSNDRVGCYEASSGEKVYEERLPKKFGATAQAAGDRGQPGAESGRPGPGARGGRGRRGGFGGGQSYASPIIADGKIYITDVSGTVYVIAAKPEFELLAKNDMSFDKSGFNGTPAVSDGNLFLRSHSHLYCIGK